MQRFRHWPMKLQVLLTSGKKIWGLEKTKGEKKFVVCTAIKFNSSAVFMNCCCCCLVLPCLVWSHQSNTQNFCAVFKKYLLSSSRYVTTFNRWLTDWRRSPQLIKRGRLHDELTVYLASCLWDGWKGVVGSSLPKMLKDRGFWIDLLRN